MLVKVFTLSINGLNAFGNKYWPSFCNKLFISSGNNGGAFSSHGGSSGGGVGSVSEPSLDGILEHL